MPSRFSPLAASALLTRFTSAPPLMRADHLSAWLRDLTTNRAPLSPPRLAASAGEDDPADPLPPWEEPIYETAGTLAVVDVCGPLVKGMDDYSCWYWGLMSTDRLQAAITELAARPDITVVLFKFNSPGGMAQGTPETAALIAALTASKLTLAFTDSLCCSAAYWMASQCRFIFSTLSADVGSIGTYLALYDYTGYLEQKGIKLELFARGTYKALGIMGQPLSAEQRAFLEADVDRINGRFLSAVRSARPTVSDETMQGQWFDGEAAVAAGLVDYVVADLSAVLGSLITSLPDSPAA